MTNETYYGMHIDNLIEKTMYDSDETNSLDDSKKKFPIKKIGRPKGCKNILFRNNYNDSLVKIKKYVDCLKDYKNLSIGEIVNLASSLPHELELYDICRTPRKLKEPVNEILTKQMKLSDTGLSEDLSCSICMSIYQNVAVVKDCLHRFCADCIEKWLRIGHQDCPKCRNRIPSRRSLRSDPIFHRIIARLFPDVQSFESMLNSILIKVNQRKIGLLDDTSSTEIKSESSVSRMDRRGNFSLSRGSLTVGKGRKSISNTRKPISNSNKLNDVSSSIDDTDVVQFNRPSKKNTTVTSDDTYGDYVLNTNYHVEMNLDEKEHNVDENIIVSSSRKRVSSTQRFSMSSYSRKKTNHSLNTYDTESKNNFYEESDDLFEYDNDDQIFTEENDDSLDDNDDDFPEKYIKKNTETKSRNSIGHRKRGRPPKKKKSIL